jgi:hypothetical protein
VKTGFFISEWTVENEMYSQGKYEMKGMKIYLLLSNGISWIHSINLVASQYSFDNSLDVWSSFGHTRR